VQGQAISMDKDTGRTVRTIGALSSVGIALVVAVVIGTALGYAADRWLNTSPWGFLGGFILGVVAGIRSLFRTVAAVDEHGRE
jgi:F0F1-type ATP synthase assembly protein I